MHVICIIISNFFLLLQKKKEELLRQSKNSFDGSNDLNRINVADILPTQTKIQTAIDISTRSTEFSQTKSEDVVTPTNPSTKDILDTIIEWVSTPTFSPNKDAESIEQVEKTTYIDTNDFVMDEKDITEDDNETIQGLNKDNIQNQENSIRHITTKVFCE